MRKAAKMLRRASPKMVETLFRLIQKAEDAGDYRAAMQGVVVALKKVLPDAVAAPDAEADSGGAEKMAEDAQRILGEFMAQHGIEPPPSH